MRKLSNNQCISKLNKYWEKHYKKFDECAEFGCDKETTDEYVWIIDIPNVKKFNLSINKLTGKITEI